MRTLLLFALLLATAAPALAQHPDRDALLEGLDVLARPGVPGNLVVFGDDAFAVVTGGKRPEPVVAGARFGKGRVVAMAHSGYLDTTDPSVDRLLRNAIAWASNGDPDEPIGILGHDDRLVRALRAAGYEAFDGADPAGDAPVSIFIWKNGHDREGLADDVVEFVRSGGGLISAACPWGWAQIQNRTRSGVTVRDHLPENRALGRFGMVYADGYVDGTAPGGYAIAKSEPGFAHAGRAFAKLQSRRKGAADGTYLVERALRALHADDDTFLPRVREVLSDLPPPEFPLGRRQALARLAVTMHTLSWRDLPPEEVEAAPGAETFPGAVPKAAERVTRTIHADPDVAGWQGTGLYLAPGEVLTVRGSGEGWRLRIGCHTDRLWHHDKWKRWPEIAHAVALGSETTRVATPFGGTVYVEALQGANAVRLELSGAVEAPRFMPGMKDWKQRRKAPGPWAELEGEHIVLSVPSAVIRELDDPAPILAFWDAVVASHCELGQTPLPERRERIVPDAQISAGYMHAGYPIMTWMDVVTPKEGRALPPLLDVEDRKQNGAWGYFHELGHNRQRRWWTFRGTGEVTCNLFTLYSHEKLCGVEPWSNPWLERQKGKAKKYLARGAQFAEWRRDPGLALITYAQVQRAFGWEPFQQVFREMEHLAPHQRPTNDQDKIDEFVRRLSLATRHDLRPFWRKWGAPLGDALMRDAPLGELPEWMPDWSELP